MSFIFVSWIHFVPIVDFVIVSVCAYVCVCVFSELYTYAKNIGAPIDLVKRTKELGRMPVVNFAAGGVATPADAALMMQLGVDGVFVGSGIFKSGDPEKRAVKKIFLNVTEKS